MNERRFEEVRRKVETVKTQLTKTEGQLEVLQERLLNEFECESIDEARDLLKKMTSEAEAKEKKVKKLYDAFEEQWADVLTGTP